MSDFLGDAFHGDRNSNLKFYGLDITASNFIVSSDDQEETLESKCNAVSSMKSETMAIKCRNVLAVSDLYICYCVKKNMLRVIHTSNSQKTLLKGHDFPILDLKFSPANKSIVCSVDDIAENSALTSTPRVIIWELSDAAELMYSILTQFNIGATIVQPHPTLSHVWAISNGSEFGIISVSLGERTSMFSSSKKGDQTKSYEELPLHMSFETKTITGISFSATGKEVVIAMKNDINNMQQELESGLIVLTLPEFDVLLQGEGSLNQIINAHINEFHGLDILSLLYLPYAILTASKSKSLLPSTISQTVHLHVWPIPSSKIQRSYLQRVDVSFPVHQNTKTLTSENNDFEFALNNGGKGDAKFIVLFHRKSNIVACLAVNNQVRDYRNLSRFFYEVIAVVINIIFVIISISISICICN